MIGGGWLVIFIENCVGFFLVILIGFIFFLNVGLMFVLFISSFEE